MKDYTIASNGPDDAVTILAQVEHHDLDHVQHPETGTNLVAADPGPAPEPVPPVTVYSLPDCSACHMTSVALGKAGVPHEVVRLDELDATTRAEIVGDAKQAPVVLAPGIGRWDGFRRDKITELAQRYTTDGPSI